MCNETIQPPETNGTMFLLEAEFVRGRVCQGSSLSGAEMSRNLYLCDYSFFLCVANNRRYTTLHMIEWVHFGDGALVLLL